MNRIKQDALPSGIVISTSSCTSAEAWQSSAGNKRLESLRRQNRLVVGGTLSRTERGSKRLSSNAEFRLSLVSLEMKIRFSPRFFLILSTRVSKSAPLSGYTTPSAADGTRRTRPWSWGDQ